MGLGVRTALRKWLGGSSSQGSTTDPLSALPRTSCDVSSLGRFTPEWLTETFTSPEIGANWEADEPKLEALGIPELTGGANPGDRRALYYLVRRVKPKRMLEIGTHIGSSTTAIAWRRRGIPRMAARLA